MIIMHEGSCLFIPRNNGTRVTLANDMTLTEACEYMLKDVQMRAKFDGAPKPVIGLAVRKVCYPRVPGKRRQSSTGWPKV
jgi:hypothetical protein